MDLISVVVLTYIVGSQHVDSEIHVEHAVCLNMTAAVQKAMRGPRKSRPTVELIDGSRAPVVAVQCLPACMADGNEPLELLARTVTVDG
jgi:hypothetical protein